MPDFFNTWLPFIYLYGVGGIFFFAGMYIIIKSGALNLKRKNHRWWVKVLFGRLFLFYGFARIFNYCSIVSLNEMEHGLTDNYLNELTIRNSPYAKFTIMSLTVAHGRLVSESSFVKFFRC